ncbi:MAG: DUF1638 domain-containing protein [Treponema sp.]|jgi:hypothetical protein|nr:DUF1638 domain-containing protein [Treponema sp.]
MLKLKVFACEVLRREISYLSSLSPCYVDVTYLPQGLHETPDKLRAMLAESIEEANKEFPFRHNSEAGRYDFIILGYGLCDNSIAGLKSPYVPLAVPRAHDCITLILGSKRRYADLFAEYPGTYWYSRGWIERSLQPGEERYQRTYQSYVDKYGEDNAEYLMEMEQGWFKSYNRAFFIDWEVLGNADYYRRYTRECASYLKWNYQEEKGSPALLEKMLEGRFDGEDVLVVPPGKTIAPSYDEGIIRYK